MTYAKKPLEKYLADIAAKTPAPGGGSVAAFVLAAAASLLVMVCRYTIDKDAYRGFRAAAKQILKISHKIQKRAQVLTDADVAAYASKDWQRAIAVPAEVARLAAQLFELASCVVRKGNQHLRSDAELAALLAVTAFQGSTSYVAVNVMCLKNRSKYAKLLNELKTKSHRIKQLTKKFEG